MDTVKEYGVPPFKTAVIHGGPGAPGSMAPVAERLGQITGVIEPTQSAGTVNGQITELFYQLSLYPQPKTIIGHSWGAMLGLLFAAQYSGMVNRLVLVGCPPLDDRYVPEITTNRIRRLNAEDAADAKRLLNKTQTSSLSGVEFERLGKLMEKADVYEKIAGLASAPQIGIQPDIFQSVWTQAAALRTQGGFRTHIKAIRCGVTVIHGKYDTHPYRGVVNVLRKGGISPDLLLLDQCGHTPWEERYAAKFFYERLSAIIKSGAL